MAYSMVEILVATTVLAIMFVSLYSGFSAGFAVIQLARENLRATQILQEKMETIRLYTWDQINTPGFMPTNFVESFYSVGTNSSSMTYTGRVTIVNGMNAAIREVTELQLHTVQITGELQLEAGSVVDANVLDVGNNPVSDDAASPPTVNITAGALVVEAGSFGDSANRIEVNIPTAGAVSLASTGGNFYVDSVQGIELASWSLSSAGTPTFDILAASIEVNNPVDANFGNDNETIFLTARTRIIGGTGTITASRLRLDAFNVGGSNSDSVIGSIASPIFLDIDTGDRYEVPATTLNGFGFINATNFTGTDFTRIFNDSNKRIFVIANFTDLIASVQGSFITAQIFTIDSSQFRADLNIFGVEGAGVLLPYDQCEDEESADCAKQ